MPSEPPGSSARTASSVSAHEAYSAALRARRRWFSRSRRHLTEQYNGTRPRPDH